MSGTEIQTNIPTPDIYNQCFHNAALIANSRLCSTD